MYSNQNQPNSGYHIYVRFPEQQIINNPTQPSYNCYDKSPINNSYIEKHQYTSSISNSFMNPGNITQNGPRLSVHNQSTNFQSKTVQNFPNTVKSMVFTKFQQVNTKASFGLGKLQSMARPANKNFDDSKDIQDDKNFNLKPTFNETTGKTRVNPSNFLPINKQKLNVYKSFVHQNTSYLSQDNLHKKNTVGLDFLHKQHKQKKLQEQKQKSFKQKPTINPELHSNPKSNDYIKINIKDEASHHQFFHEYSAPNLGNIDKHYHHQPVEVIHKNQPSHTKKNQKYTPAEKYTPPESIMKRLNFDKFSKSNETDTSPKQVQLASEGSHSKPLHFTKASKKTFQMSSLLTTQQNTPVKSKLVAPAFFKNKITTANFKNPIYDLSERSSESPPKIMKSTFSDDGSDDSITYISQIDRIRQVDLTLDDFQLGDKLGKGAFGDVYIARQKNIGFICALKKMSIKRIKQQKRQEHVIRQLKIQLYLDHQHLTSLYGYFSDQQYLYLIMQYLPDGNLSQIKRKKKTSEKQTAQILRQVCEGLKHMHKNQIIHRDLKPENIFINENYLKLGDFGCSVFTDSMRNTVVSCLEYSSPEQMNNKFYNEKIDVWGVGVLAYELLAGKSPFEASLMDQAHNLGQVDFSKIEYPADFSKLAINFISSLLNIDPIDRLDINEALEHKFITTNVEQMHLAIE